METPSPLSALGSIQFPAIPDSQASLQLALLYQLENSQWKSAAEIETAQFQQLHILLKHAQQNVPYYTKLFEKHSIQIPERMDRAFFEKIPISQRTAYQDCGDDFGSKKMPEGHGQMVVARTSGSTGQPLKFGRSSITQTIWRALSTREHLWHGRDFTKKIGAIRIAPPDYALAPAGVQTENWGAGIDKVFVSGPTVFLNASSPLEGQLEWLLREKPSYLLSFPSSLVALTRYAEQKGVKLPEIFELRCVGEKLSAEHRAYLKDKWQAKVTDMYSCEEMGYLALQCPKNEHYHIQSESVFVEIVDENGRACAPGTRGRVVITSLNNFVTPFIRYDIGDIAEYGAPCSCGRGLPVIQHIHGRTRNRLLLPNGENRMPRLGEFVIYKKYDDAGIRQLKCIQHSLEKVELQIVAARTFTEIEQNDLIDILLKNLDHNFTVELTFPTEILRNPNGKLEVFECRI
jgi:phenylacetate-CoA ligase